MLSTHLYKIVPALEELITSEEGKRLPNLGRPPATVSCQSQVSGMEKKGSQISEGRTVPLGWPGKHLCSWKVLGLNLEKERARYIRIIEKTRRPGGRG